MVVERVRLQDLQFEKFLLDNKPVVIEDVNIFSWPILDYFLHRESKMIDPSTFIELCGEEVIPIHTKQGIEDMKISDFMNRILLGECLYAKDWHMFHYCSENVYSVPSPFLDDWLNWFWDRCQNNCDDYRFVYIGGPNSFTGVHHDVLCSYSWSVNLYGRKKWTLWSPNNVSKLTFHSKENSIIVDAREGQYDPLLYPNASKSSPFIIYQDVNEAVFIPSGWYHMVENLDGPVTISLNHNWFNGYTLLFQWDYLLNQYELVYRELSDFHPLAPSFSSSNVLKMSLSEWYQHSQYLLQIQTGIDFVQYLSLIVLRIFVLSQVQNEIKRCELVDVLCAYLYRHQRDKDGSQLSGFEEYLTRCCTPTELDKTVYDRLSTSFFSSTVSHRDDNGPYGTHLSSPFTPFSNSVFHSEQRHQRMNRYDERIQMMNSSNDSWNGWRYTLYQGKCIVSEILEEKGKQTRILDSVSDQLQLNVEYVTGLLIEYANKFLDE